MGQFRSETQKGKQTKTHNMSENERELKTRTNLTVLDVQMFLEVVTAVQRCSCALNIVQWFSSHIMENWSCYFELLNQSHLRQFIRVHVGNRSQTSV